MEIEMNDDYYFDRINKIIYYIEQFDLIDIQNRDTHYDHINLQHCIQQKINLLNEIWNDFIPNYEIVDINKCKQFVHYILNCNTLNIQDIIRYSINRIDELQTDFECRIFTTMCDYTDFIFNNQPFYDNLLIEILDEICCSIYSHFIGPILSNMIYIYKNKVNKFNSSLSYIYNKINNELETKDICNKINSLNII